MNTAEKELFITILQNFTFKEESMVSVRSLSGGDINQAYKVETSSGTWFAKSNLSKRFPGIFEAEAKGLKLLKETGAMSVPSVIGFGESEEHCMLVLEFMEQGREQENFWEEFGRRLALIHKNFSSHYGLDHLNYIGSLPQYNDFNTSWIDFFIFNRLEVQMRLARDAGILESSDIRLFENLYPRLPDFFPDEKPSLLHGDLWSGNFMVNKVGKACLIDPAVYYGHRLMDIGMSRLFGGFTVAFYDAYREEFPLEENWIMASDIANLYPLMVHVNLFGGGYLSSVRSVLKRF
jgi:protein-ribulosamine 3-kinase